MNLLEYLHYKKSFYRIVMAQMIYSIANKLNGPKYVFLAMRYIKVTFYRMFSQVDVIKEYLHP